MTMDNLIQNVCIKMDKRGVYKEWCSDVQLHTWNVIENKYIV